MRKGRSPSFWAVLPALALFVLASCLLDEDSTAKRGSEVENEVYGILVALDGKPVQGAKVKAVPAAAIAKRAESAADSDSVVTDSRGRYAFKSLGSGLYNLFGDYESGALVVLIPGVNRGDTSRPLNLGTDTLRAPGRIRGRVLLGDRGKEGIFAYVPGTSYLAVSDDSGRFVIGGVPQGIHQVRYSAPGFLIEPDVNVRVLSGQTTDLPVKRLAYDPALPPPAPTGLKAVYDTLNQRVSLSWDSVPVSDLDGYVIYRDKSSFLDPQVVTDGFTRMTSFVDTAPGVPESMEKRDLVYRIKSRDKEVNLSLSYSAPAEVTTVSRLWVTTRMEIKVLGTRDGSASPGDSLRLVLQYENPTRPNRLASWYLEGRSAPVRSTPLASRSGTDTLAWVAGSAGLESFTARVEDGAGSIWSAHLAVPIIPDHPRADAGRDTVVSIGDRVLLKGAGTDRFGAIAKWEWDIGGNGTFREGGRDTSFHAPLQADSGLACILRITDDDGQIALDTVSIKVLRDAPQAGITGARSAQVNARVLLTAEAIQQFGSIVMYKWDDGKSPGWDDSSSSMREAAYLFQAKGDYPVRLLVRDDDGNADSAVHVVAIGNKDPTLGGFRDTLLSIGDTARFKVAAADSNGIRAYLWDFDGNGIVDDSTAGGEASHVYRDTGMARAVVTVLDAFDGRSRDTALVTVVRDPPKASLSGPASARVNALVRFTASAAQQFGTIAMYKWDDGIAPGWDDSSATKNEAAFLYRAKGSYTVRLLVRDDDGNSDSVSALLAVTNDNPVLAGFRDTLFSVNDTAVFSITATDVDGIRTFLWDFDGDGQAEDSSATGRAKRAYPGPAGTYRAVVTVRDSMDGATRDTAVITVIQDVPKPAIQGPATAKVGAPVRFTPAASQQFGSIVLYKWDDGKSPGWDDSTAAPADAEFTYAAKGAYPVRLLVRDDDGNSDSVTFNLAVTNDNPVITGFRDTTISINDTVRYHVSAADQDGIRDYRWDFESTFIQDDSTGTGSLTRVFPSPHFPGTSRVILTVRDAFDGLTRDTAFVFVVLDPPQPSVTGPSSVKVNSPAAFQAQVGQSFGSIVMYKWDDGKAPGWDDSSATLTNVSFTYTSKGTYPVRLYVRDDDGLVDSAAHPVQVINDNPVINAGLRDTAISIKDHLNFLIAAFDPEGIRCYLWDWNGDGIIDDSTDVPGNAHTFPAVAGAITVKVTVRDSFDGVSTIAAVYDVLQDPPRVGLGTDTSTGTHETIHVKGSASDGHGTIASREWSIAGGPFVFTTRNDTTVQTPGTSVRLDLPVILRVTDDDGNTVSDTMVISVLPSPIKELADLRVTSGTLTPAFQAAVGQYADSVESHTGIVGITAIAASKKVQSISIGGASTASDSAFADVAVNPGDNTVTITVTAEDGSQGQYAIKIRRRMGWVRKFESGTRGFGKSVKQMGDRGYIIAGHTQSNADVYLLRTDSLGVPQAGWPRLLGGSGLDYASSIQLTGDGGLVMTGGTGTSSNTDIYLSRTDAQGTALSGWPKSFDISGNTDGRSVQQTGDGGFVVVGGLLSDVVLLRTDEHGGALPGWPKIFDEGNRETAVDVRQTQDGGFIVCGSTSSFSSNPAAYLLRTDSQGDLLQGWPRSYPVVGDGAAWAVKQTPDGGFIAAGTASDAEGLYEAYLLRVDAQGNVLQGWPKTFGGPGDHRAHSVHVMPDGGFMVGGSTSPDGRDGYNPYLLRTDAQGQVLAGWPKTIGGIGTNSVRFPMELTGDGGLIIIGDTQTGIFLIKTDAEGVVK